MTHDPLCPYGGMMSGPDDCRIIGTGVRLCDLLARARADERERIARAIELTGTPSEWWACSDAWGEALALAAAIARGGESSQMFSTCLAVSAMADIEHDDYCPDKGDRRCDCDWEARVRADEREQFNGWMSPEEVAGQMELVRADERDNGWGNVLGKYRNSIEDELLKRLRAQVEALEDAGCRRVVGGCDCRRSQALRDVLSLLGKP